MNLVQLLIDGLCLGALYGLLGSGVSLCWSASRTVNVAQGAFALLGADVGYWFVERTALDGAWSVPLAAGALFAMGGLLGLVLLGPASKGPPLLATAALFGLQVTVIEACANLLPAGRAYSATLSERIQAGSATLSGVQILGLAASFGLVLLTAGLAWAAARPRAEEDSASADVTADIRKGQTLSFAWSAALAGAAGALLGLTYGLGAGQGYFLSFVAAAVMVIGGLGSIPGALLAGLVLGVAQTCVEGAWGSGLAGVTAFALAAGVLLVRPGVTWPRFGHAA